MRVDRTIVCADTVGLGLWAATSPMRDDGDDRHLLHRVTSWPGMISLGLLLGLDDVAIGFGLGVAEAAPLVLGIVVASTTLVFASLGLWVGHVACRRFERVAIVLSGLVLAGVGLAVVLGRGVRARADP